MKVEMAGWSKIPKEHSWMSGTAETPNSVIFFHKKVTTVTILAHDSKANMYGWLLFAGNITGIRRIVATVKFIFENFNNPLAPPEWKWQAAENIFKGFVEIIPGFGLPLLIGYLVQKARDEDVFIPALEKVMGDSLGVMRDGIIVDVFPVSHAVKNGLIDPTSKALGVDQLANAFWKKMDDKPLTLQNMRAILA